MPVELEEDGEVFVCQKCMINNYKKTHKMECKCYGQSGKSAAGGGGAMPADAQKMIEKLEEMFKTAVMSNKKLNVVVKVAGKNIKYEMMGEDMEQHQQHDIEQMKKRAKIVNLRDISHIPALAANERDEICVMSIQESKHPNMKYTIAGRIHKDVHLSRVDKNNELVKTNCPVKNWIYNVVECDDHLLLFIGDMSVKLFNSSGKLAHTLVEKHRQKLSYCGCGDMGVVKRKDIVYFINEKYNVVKYRWKEKEEKLIFEGAVDIKADEASEGLLVLRENGELIRIDEGGKQKQKQQLGAGEYRKMQASDGVIIAGCERKEEKRSTGVEVLDQTLSKVHELTFCTYGRNINHIKRRREVVLISYISSFIDLLLYANRKLHYVETVEVCGYPFTYINTLQYIDGMWMVGGWGRFRTFEIQL